MFEKTVGKKLQNEIQETDIFQSNNIQKFIGLNCPLQQKLVMTEMAENVEGSI